MKTATVDLSAQACIHAAGQTFPKNTLYNGICDLESQFNRASALIDVQGHSYSNAEIDDIRRSREFKKHRDALKASGKDRD
jgi:hypothetical protein